MKVEIILSSDFLSHAENIWLHDCSIELEWNCPALPRKGELIDSEIIINNWPEIEDKLSHPVANLCWEVVMIEWYSDQGVVIPKIKISGT